MHGVFPGQAGVINYQELSTTRGLDIECLRDRHSAIERE